jgi:hypothetical protein
MRGVRGYVSWPRFASSLGQCYGFTSVPSSETRHAAKPKHSVSIKLASKSRTEAKWLTRASGTERPSSPETGG